MLLSSEYVQMFLYERHCGGIMAEKTTLFVLNERAVPEVLLKVVEAKKLHCRTIFFNASAILVTYHHQSQYTDV